MDPNRILYLANSDVEGAGVDMKAIIDALDAAYRLKGQGQVEMPSKIGIHTRPNALIHAMPAYIRPTGTAGMKWIGAYPENFRFNVPQISGLIVLNDEQTGLPYCIMDCRWITAKRTGAKTAVAAGFFARKNAASVGILGCGVQGRSNLEALCERFAIRRVHAYDMWLLPTHRPTRSGGWILSSRPGLSSKSPRRSLKTSGLSRGRLRPPWISIPIGNLKP
jgi:ornithine cyclodeaminase/alanine dehydrogenase-like protein (mu-crystallin family)